MGTSHWSRKGSRWNGGLVRAGLLKREEAMGKSSYERAEGALERRGY